MCLQFLQQEVSSEGTTWIFGWFTAIQPTKRALLLLGKKFKSLLKNTILHGFVWHAIVVRLHTNWSDCIPFRYKRMKKILVRFKYVTRTTGCEEWVASEYLHQLQQNSVCFPIPAASSLIMVSLPLLLPWGVLYYAIQTLRYDIMKLRNTLISLIDSFILLVDQFEWK